MYLSTCSFLNHHINTSVLRASNGQSIYDDRYYLSLFHTSFRIRKYTKKNTLLKQTLDTYEVQIQFQWVIKFNEKNQNYRANRHAVIKKMIKISQQNTIVWKWFLYINLYVIFLYVIFFLFLRTNISFRHRLMRELSLSIGSIAVSLVN